MKDCTVHVINDKLTVSVHALPGFQRLGRSVIRGANGERTGSVTIYYVGDFFQSRLESGEYNKMAKAVNRLAQNYATREGIGRYATRLNLVASLRIAAKRFIVKEVQPNAKEQTTITKDQ